MEDLIPELIRGGRHADARGALRFVNDFDLSPVKRFYTIANSAEQPKRGWIMHKRETKWFFPLCGTTRIEVVCDASSTPTPTTYTLNAAEPRVLCVPPNHWFLIDQSLPTPTPTAYTYSEVMVFSNCFVGEFPNDDFRK